MRMLWTFHTLSPPPPPIDPATMNHLEDCHLPQKKRSFTPVSIAPRFLVTSLCVVAPPFRKLKSSCSLVPRVFFVDSGARTGMTMHPINGHKAIETSTKAIDLNVVFRCGIR